MTERQFLTFNLNEHYFAVPTDYIHRVIDTLQSRHILLQKPSLEGVIVFENKLVPMMDLAKYLGFPTNNVFYQNVEESVIVFSVHHYLFSIRIDHVTGMMFIPESDLKGFDLGEADVGFEHTELIQGVFSRNNEQFFEIDVEKFLYSIIYN